MTTAVRSTNIKVVENNIPGTIGLVTTSFVNTNIRATENKILNVSGLVKKIDYGAKIKEKNISLVLIITNLRITQLMQR